MKEFSTSPLEILSSLWNNKDLLVNLTKREILGRYKGAFLGVFWSFFSPLFMLAVYTFVFGKVFHSRWTGGSDSNSEFALILFAGLIIFNLFAECISRAPSLILSNANYVKKVVFPLELLPWVIVGSALFHAFVSLLVWFVAYYILFGLPHITVLYLPIVLLPFVFLIVGISWILASLGVFLRDIGQIIGVVITAIMFLSPIFFPLSSLPQTYQSILIFNPLTLPITQIRQIMFWGETPNLELLSLYFSVSLITLWFGFYWFQKMRKGFADVL